MTQHPTVALLWNPNMSQYYPDIWLEGLRKNEKTQLRYLVSAQRFEPGTSRIRRTGASSSKIVFITVVIHVTLTFGSYTVLDRAMDQEVSRQPFTADTGFEPGSIHFGFVVDKVALGQVFLRVLQFSPVNIIPPSFSTLISSGV
jgi:hypothetical protein